MRDYKKGALTSFWREALCNLGMTFCSGLARSDTREFLKWGEELRNDDRKLARHMKELNKDDLTQDNATLSKRLREHEANRTLDHFQDYSVKGQIFRRSQHGRITVK